MIRATTRTLSSMIILSEADVKRCLPVSAAISANRKALSSLLQNGDGGAMVPARIGLPYHAPNDGNSDSPADWSLFKPAAYYPPQHQPNDDTIMGMKLVSVRANNRTKFNKPSVPATIMLVDAETGEVSAILAATYLTAARTASGSALATEMALSGKNTEPGVTLVVFGAGLQAEMHIKCIQYVANVTKLVIVNRSRQRAEKLKEKLLTEQHDPEYEAQTPLSDISISLLSDEEGVRNAVGRADVIVTATNTVAPLFSGEWLKPGCHINGVGSYTPLMQEIDEISVKRSRVLIDTMEALEVGDLRGIQPTSPNFAGLIGDALVGSNKFGDNRGDSVDCTFFKSVGTAIQDVASAHMAVKNATENKMGTNVIM
ncbi:hypothetical protein ACHAWF_001409 [Thalassiosira exigua]